MQEFDLIVIGAGPGGYVAAIRAAQLGLKVACVDKNELFGGTCLRVGCIPSKAMLESSERYHEAVHELQKHGIKATVELDLPTMQQRKTQVVRTLAQGVRGLLQKNQITAFIGHGQFTSPNEVLIHPIPQNGSAPNLTEPTPIKGNSILIATGSKVAGLQGVITDGEYVVTSDEALDFAQVPARLVVIGAGYIGLEMGSIWNRLGSQVIVLEYLDRILPGMDGELAANAQKVFTKQGLQFRLGTQVTSARAQAGRCMVEVAAGEPIECDRVLLSVGRTPNTDQLGLEQIGLQVDQRGRIPVDAHFATAVPGVYAIGDVIVGPMLAHKAEEEGIACVEHLVTGYGHVNYDTIPGIVYTHPEIATVGKTEEQLKENNTPYRKGIFSFRGNGRALAIGTPEGMIKILAHATTDRILGVHIIGPRAGDLIAEAATAMEFGASAEDLARTCHAHPTLAEALKEAALAVADRAIHA